LLPIVANEYHSFHRLLLLLLLLLVVPK
jgi:hypothetical protein